MHPRKRPTEVAGPFMRESMRGAIVPLILAICALESMCGSLTPVGAACNVGTYSVNATLCDPCAAGSFQSVNNTNTTSCFPCTPGSSQPNMGASACVPCGPGTFMNSSGSTLSSCYACTPGTFQVNGNALQCELCPFNSSSSMYAASTCTACTAGTYTLDLGASACIDINTTISSNSSSGGQFGNTTTTPSSNYTLTRHIQILSSALSWVEFLILFGTLALLGFAITVAFASVHHMPDDP